MFWTLIIIAVFAAALLLIGGLYAAGKGHRTSDSPPDDSVDADEADADGE